MKPFFLILFFLSFFYGSHAQIPSFDWAKSFGGISGDAGITTVTDAAGNIYVMGTFWHTADFDTGPGVLNLTSAGQGDNFIVKYNANGDLLWARQFGNASNDNAISMTLDNSGNLYVTGSYQATVDFDPGPGVFNMTCGTTGYAAFALKLSATSGDFIWARELVETDYFNAGVRVVTSTAGNVYISGRFKGTADFDPGPGTFILTSTLAVEVLFVSRFDADGNFTWVKQIGGWGGQACYAMAVDPLENIYMAGGFSQTCDFDPNAPVFNLSANNSITFGESDTFILKLDANGNFIFAKQVNADRTDKAFGIALDPAGAIFLTGEFAGNADFDTGPGVVMLNAGDYPDGYVLKLHNDGNFAWAKQFAGIGAANSNSRGFSIALDGSGNIYSTGDFTGGVDFDPSPTTFPLNTTNLQDSYISKLDPDGNFLYALPLTGSYFFQSSCLIVDAQRNITVTGRHIGTSDLDPTAGTYIASAAGSDVFVIHLNQACAQTTTSTITAVACNQYMLNNQSYTSSGTYLQTLQNTAGCDSLITLHLVIGGSTNLFSATACDNYSWQGQNYTTSGNYTITYPGMGGCDSVLKLNLVINYSVTTNASAFICAGQAYEGYSTTGVFTDRFTGANGCDSIRVLNLTVGALSYSSITATICEGQSLEGFSTSGQHVRTLVAANGCDSIRTVYLTVNPTKLTNVNRSICYGQTYLAGGAMQTSSGVYRDTLRTYLNCDSVVITNLVVHPSPRPDLGTDTNLCTGSAKTFSAGSFNAYSWQDGSTGATFRADTAGLYWVTVTDQNNCSATDSVSINTMLPLPANFLKAKDSVCSYDQLMLQSTRNYNSYLWSNGVVQRNNTIASPGQYWLQVTDANGCKGLDTIEVVTKFCKNAVYIPTAFTPNGDGKNDFFKATVHGKLLSFRLELYNRYGELIFRASDPLQQWDGVYKGGHFATNVFVWYCVYQLEGEEPGVQKGTVMLIR